MPIGWDCADEMRDESARCSRLPAQKAQGGIAIGALPNTYVLTGEQRTRGVELELAWRPRPGVELTGAYTYLDPKITADSRLLVGARLSSVPKHIANLWARYTI